MTLQLKLKGKYMISRDCQLTVVLWNKNIKTYLDFYNSYVVFSLGKIFFTIHAEDTEFDFCFCFSVMFLLKFLKINGFLKSIFIEFDVLFKVSIIF